MTSAQGDRPGAPPRRSVSADPQSAADLRRMALHLETAAVLDLRAARSGDAAQVAVLRRRAEQRRQEAERIRRRLSALGVALRSPSARP